MNDIKHKTEQGFIWTFIETIINYSIQFIVGIILARILSPSEFGLIGMIMVFITVSQSLIYSGLNTALIQKKDCTNLDYSSVFYFNIFLGILLFLFLYFTSGFIADFYKTDQLNGIIKVLSLGLIIDAFGIIPQTILTKKMDFKTLTHISVISSILSGLVAVYMAYNNFGVWSLVALSLIKNIINTIYYWFIRIWKPIFVFSFSSLNGLYKFGKNLMLSNLIDVFYQNSLYIIIGKYYSAKELGFYNRAERFQALFSQTLTSVLAKVAFPALSNMNNNEFIKDAYQKMLQRSMYLNSLLMFGLGAIASNLIPFLIGEKWNESIPLLQLLIFVGVLYPAQSLNSDILKVYGRSDYFLKLEIIKKTIAILILIISSFFGIKMMIVGLIIFSVIAYLINVYFSSKFVDYCLESQLKDIFPSIIISLIIGIVMYLSVYWLTGSYLIKLIIQLIVGLVLVLIQGEILKNRDYQSFKNLLLKYVK